MLDHELDLKDSGRVFQRGGSLNHHWQRIVAWVKKIMIRIKKRQWRRGHWRFLCI